MNNLMFIGDGIDATIISGNRSNGTGYSTFGSATFGKFIVMFLEKFSMGY